MSRPTASIRPASSRCARCCATSPRSARQSSSRATSWPRCGTWPTSSGSSPPVGSVREGSIETLLQSEGACASGSVRRRSRAPPGPGGLARQSSLGARSEDGWIRPDQHRPERGGQPPWPGPASSPPQIEVGTDLEELFLRLTQGTGPGRPRAPFRASAITTRRLGYEHLLLDPAQARPPAGDMGDFRAARRAARPHPAGGRGDRRRPTAAGVRPARPGYLPRRLRPGPRLQARPGRPVRPHLRRGDRRLRVVLGDLKAVVARGESRQCIRWRRSPASRWSRSSHS